MKSSKVMKLTALSLLMLLISKSMHATVNETANVPSTRDAALSLWHNDDLTKHPKGSCASCHGPDFIDLARINTSDADIIRRSLIDGATLDEAQTLKQAIREMQVHYSLSPDENPREFRPFQPGGSLLLPDLQEEFWHIANIKRDVAFAEQISTWLPTVFGEERIGTIAQAKQARDEYLDLARGTNTAGANTEHKNLMNIKVGIEYPLWSADIFHGDHEGTMNDWLADVGFIAQEAFKEEWYHVQKTYLDAPTTEHFWAMFAASQTMLTLATPLNECTETNSHHACGAMRASLRHKFEAALIGQHMLRAEQLGTLSDFIKPPIAFAYLDDSQQYKSIKKRSWGGRSMLPSPLWEIGDAMGRVALRGQVTRCNDRHQTSRERAASLGLPHFVQDSVSDITCTQNDGHDIRLSWFWLGFTMDPSFARISAGNATRTAEYLVGSLMEARLFNHNAFMTHMRLLSVSHLDESAAVEDRRSPSGVRRISNDRLHQVTEYSYFLAYNRHLLTQWNQWNESIRHGGAPLPAGLKERSTALWSTQVSNGMRMTSLLLLDMLQQQPERISKKWLERTINDIDRGRFMVSQRQHWARFQPQHQADDLALVAVLENAILALR